MSSSFSFIKLVKIILFYLRSSVVSFKSKIKNADGSSTGIGYSSRNVESSRNVQPDDISGESYLLTGEEDQILDYYEVYSKVKVPYMNVLMKMIKIFTLKSKIHLLKEDLKPEKL